MFLDESEERVRKYFESIGVADEQVNISPADMNGIDYEYSKYLYNDMPVKKIMRRGFKKNRSENSVLNDPWIHNGSCIPSLVRLFVNTEGDFFPCEKITESPFLSIGNVSDGLDIDKITYMTDIAKLTEHQCRHCWGLRYLNNLYH